MVSMTRTENEFRLTGRHVLFALIAFFVAVGAVNFYFIRVALQTHSGALGPHAYSDGLKYNENIAAAERQSKLGWQDALAVSADGKSIIVTLTDRDGKGLDGLKATLVVERPATDREDSKLELAAQGSGRYGTALPQGAYGNYIASLDVVDLKTPGEIVYRARRRLWVSH